MKKQHVVQTKLNLWPQMEWSNIRYEISISREELDRPTRVWIICIFDPIQEFKFRLDIWNNVCSRLLTLFLPAMSWINPYTVIMWHKPVGIGWTGTFLIFTQKILLNKLKFLCNEKVTESLVTQEWLMHVATMVYDSKNFTYLRNWFFSNHWWPIWKTNLQLTLMNIVSPNQTMLIGFSP